MNNEINLHNTLATKLKFRRKHLRKTQQEMAKLFGISLRLYQKLESGCGNPTLETISKIIAYYNCSINDLFVS